MERKGIFTAIISISAAVILATASPVLSASEETPPKSEIPATEAGKTTAEDKPSLKTDTADKGDQTSPDKKGKEEPKETEETVSVLLRAPFFSPMFTDTPLASVSDERITFQDLRDALASVHEKMTVEKETGAKKSFAETLRRLINVKLVVLEARSIELDKLPEVREDLAKNSEMQLRQVLFQDRVKDIKADEKEVERLYKEMIREWKLNSVLFKNENEAKKFEAEIKAGKSFDELRAQALKDGVGEQAGQNEEVYANLAALGPVIGGAISGLEPGSVTPIIRLQNQFAIVKVLDMRSVDNPELKEKARNHLLSRMRLETLQKFKDELYKRYVKENARLIRSIDYEAPKPGLAKLLKDKRVLVTVKGEKPVTVSELTTAVRDKYFHGVQRAIEEKKVNREKRPILDELVSKRVFKREAFQRGLENSKEYKDKLRQYEETLLFGTFIEKVVKPDVTISFPEVKAYYDEHLSDYRFPQMLQIEEIVFMRREDAQSAIDKLRKGMDFKWLKNNAEGQVAKDAKGILEFKGQMLTVKSFPEGLQKVLSGAQAGDYRLYESPEGYNYVLFVAKETPSRTQDLEEVKDDVAQKVRWRNFNTDVEEWFKKLKDAYPVKIYLQEQ